MDTRLKQYLDARQLSEEICKPLEIEDYVVQPRSEVSPPKWHLAHCSWFFENFLLSSFLDTYKNFDPSFNYLFNSYYKTQGEHWIQGERGHLSRPTVKTVYDYRRHVDEFVQNIYSDLDEKHLAILETGIHHEQQHQELLLMDIKSILASNPSMPVYKQAIPDTPKHIELSFIPFEGGISSFGSHEGKGFSYCNERPNHQHLLHSFELANRPISNAEFKNFIEDDAYNKPWHWKSDAWNWLKAENIQGPLYWYKRDGQWFEYTFAGTQGLEPEAPVCHLSWYEADAYASWAGARLPSEYELEYAYDKNSSKNIGFYDKKTLTPRMNKQSEHFYSLTGNLWEWTQSPYVSYPGYRRPAGAFGEYNQKFMANQFVLRGGCFATSKNHFRATYRNFFYPQQRWAFTGLRLAKDIEC